MKSINNFDSTLHQVSPRDTGAALKWVAELLLNVPHQSRRSLSARSRT
jgi:hypothetical protein